MIKKANLVFIAIAIFGLMLTSCNNAKKADTASDVVHNMMNSQRIMDEQGTFIIDENTGRPAIRVHTDGTIDEVFIYLITNSSNNLPDAKTKVRFGGKVSKSDVVSKIGGHSYYELELESLEEI